MVVHPPWLKPERGGITDGFKERLVGRANEWYAGAVRDPNTDFGLSYTDVAIEGDTMVEAKADAPHKPRHERFTLHGWHVPAPSTSSKAKICIVLVHGAGRDRRAWLRHMPFLHSAGYGLLAFDCREHGFSSSKKRGIGWHSREATDVVVTCNYAKNVLGYSKIVVCGTSQGASSTIVAAAHLPHVAAVIAENPYSSRYEAMKNSLSGPFGRSFTPLLEPLRNAIVSIVATLAIRIRLGIRSHKFGEHDDIRDLRDVGLRDPIDVIASLKRPILIMHGDNDAVLPHSYSEKLFEAATEPKHLWIVEGGEHTGLWNRHKEKFESTVLQFLAAHVQS